MNRIFKLEWGSYEDAKHILFTNPQVKSEAKFKKDIKSILLKHGKNFLSHNNNIDMIIGQNDFGELVASKIQELGYEPIEPIHFNFERFYVDKNNSLDWQKEFSEIGGKRLHKMVNSHNDNITNPKPEVTKQKPKHKLSKSIRDHFLKMETANTKNNSAIVGRYLFDDIMKFSDGWWITSWSPTQRRIIKSHGPYKTKDEAKCDVMVLNSKYRNK